MSKHLKDPQNTSDPRVNFSFKRTPLMTPYSVPVIHTSTPSLTHTRFHKHAWVISAGRKEHVSLFKGLTLYIWKASSDTSECFEYSEVPNWNKIIHEIIMCSNHLSSSWHKLVKNSWTGKSCVPSWVIDLFGGKQVFKRYFAEYVWHEDRGVKCLGLPANCKITDFDKTWW